jgi:hypothetical protein
LVLEKKAIPNREELAGVYILENTPLGGGYQLMSFGGKNMKRQRENGGKYLRKRKKGERK